MGAADHREALRRGAGSLRTHGSTFHAAHLALGRRCAEAVRVLYGFCRYVDDLADEQEPEAAARALAALRDDLLRGGSAVPEVAGFLELSARHALDPRVTEEFLRGIESDLEPVAPRTRAELLRYCYRVAGTVGIHMCALMGVTDRRALHHAVDLGIAMQLTNISRDVLEDAGRGRVYLPRSMAGGAIDPAALVSRDPGTLARARRGVEGLLDLAEDYYRSADRGMVYLPARARVAVLAASRRYEAIGPRIRRFRAGALPRRAHVAGAAKAWHMGRGVASALLAGAARIVGTRSAHSGALHRTLPGLPGIHRSAP